MSWLLISIRKTLLNDSDKAFALIAAEKQSMEEEKNTRDQITNEALSGYVPIQLKRQHAIKEHNLSVCKKYDQLALDSIANETTARSMIGENASPKNVLEDMQKKHPDAFFAIRHAELGALEASRRAQMLTIENSVNFTQQWRLSIPSYTQKVNTNYCLLQNSAISKEAEIRQAIIAESTQTFEGFFKEDRQKRAELVELTQFGRSVTSTLENTRRNDHQNYFDNLDEFESTAGMRNSTRMEYYSLHNDLIKLASLTNREENSFKDYAILALKNMLIYLLYNSSSLQNKKELALQSGVGCLFVLVNELYAYAIKYHPIIPILSFGLQGAPRNPSNLQDMISMLRNVENQARESASAIRSTQKLEQLRNNLHRIINSKSTFFTPEETTQFNQEIAKGLIERENLNREAAQFRMTASYFDSST